jgi:ABC-2 type transport system permease protein
MKTLLVLKNEFISTVTRKSFLFTLFLLPLVSFIVVLVIASLGQGGLQPVRELFSSPSKQVAEGYVDHSGLITRIPPEIKPGSLLSFPDEAAARQALQAGRIGAYYVVAEDFMATGKVVCVRPDFNPIAALSQAQPFLSLLHYNLLAGNDVLVRLYDQPIQAERVFLGDQPQREQENPLTFFLPYIVSFLFYILILTSSSLMLNSVTAEKQNRVLEILLVSVSPTQMLAGKIIALGMAGLLQTMLWSGSGFLLLRLSGQAFNLPAAFQLPATILVWGLVFFLLGYALYASLMAAIGALVPNLREASQATMVVILPMVVPMMFINTLIQNPLGPLATAISIFPFTAPAAMMTRLAAANLPLWQPLLAAGLLALTALLVVRAVAGMFRAQTLLSGQPFNLKRYFSALTGRSG